MKVNEDKLSKQYTPAYLMDLSAKKAMRTGTAGIMYIVHYCCERIRISLLYLHKLTFFLLQCNGCEASR